MTKIAKDKRIALVLPQTISKEEHFKLEDLKFDFVDWQDGHYIYESRYTVATRTDAAERTDEIEAAGLSLRDAYVFTRKSEITVGE